MELMKEQENLEDPDRLREIRLRMTELNHQYFGTSTAQPKAIVGVLAE